MTGQLPQPGKIFLDRVAHCVPTMDAATEALERCGFSPDPIYRPDQSRPRQSCPGWHREAVRDAPSPIHRDPRGHERYAARAPTYRAACAPSWASSRRLQHGRRCRRASSAGGGRFSGLPLGHAPASRGPGGRAWARVTIARAKAFSITRTGALALAAVWVATRDPAEAADRFRRFTGRPISQEDEVSTIALERGAVRIATPEFLARTVGVEPGPLLPYLTASEIQVVSLPRLHDHLNAARLAYAIVRDGIAVSLPSSVGGTLLFRQFPV